MMLRFKAWNALAVSAIFLCDARAQNLSITNALPLAATNAPTVADTNTAPGVTNAGPKVPQIPEKQYTNTIGMELLQVPGGYWAGKFEVTQKEYQNIMGANPGTFAGEQNPVDNVNWEDAVEFCRKLTEHELEEKELPAGFTYTLPTEDQWRSLAADASLADAVTSAAAPRAGTAAVGSLGPNSLGLYDTRGNVMEFCLGDTTKPYRVLHGGSWQDRIDVNLRLEFRNYCPPTERKNTYGFRCILLPAPGK
jgi:formylglycine-generating enzyme required for sulfatase activity